MTRLPFKQWAKPLRWLDGRPLLATIEPYRLRIFEEFLDSYLRNAALLGRGKKNWKSADGMTAALRAVTEDHPAGSQVYIVANDRDQARDDLVLLEKLVRANPLLTARLRIKRHIIERKDGKGFVEVLPAQDVAGLHGKTFRLVVFDEIHAYRDWDVFEALAFDPSRRESQWWITSYASLIHKPGAPLFDLMKVGKAGSDPRLLFSWYGGDFTTDADLADADPETRANPSRATWGNDAYLDQQRRLLPAHKFRRLHLNLPGTPEGSAFQAEPIVDAIDRGVRERGPVPGLTYAAFVDMSGGSADDAVLAIGHRDADGRAIVDCLQDQGPRPPFDPNVAVERFVRTLRRYGIARICGDAYAGRTFATQFETAGVTYDVSPQSKSEIYAVFEPVLNARQVRLPDVPTVEQQLLGLVWRGGRIDHPVGEHDDYANAACGVVTSLAGWQTCSLCDDPECSGLHLASSEFYERRAAELAARDPFEYLTGVPETEVASRNACGEDWEATGPNTWRRLKPSLRPPEPRVIEISDEAWAALSDEEREKWEVVES